MRVRVLKKFDGYRPGQVFDWGDGMARIMVARGLVERLPDVETAVVERQVERAVMPPARKAKK